jgi:hypothetical protein
MSRDGVSYKFFGRQFMPKETAAYKFFMKSRSEKIYDASKQWEMPGLDLTFLLNSA